MSNPDRSILAQQFDLVVNSIRDGFRILRQRGPNRIQFWFIALLIGIAAGFAALFFRKGVNALQTYVYGTEDVRLLE